RYLMACHPSVEPRQRPISKYDVLSEVTLLWNAGPSSFQDAAAWAPVCCSRDRRARQRIPDKQPLRPSPAGTHHQPSLDTHEPNRPGFVPCISAARLPALHESRHGVARTSYSQGSPSRREPCPEGPRNYAHCLEALRNREPSCVVWFPIVVSYHSSCIPPSFSSDKKARRSKPHSRTDPRAYATLTG